MHGSDDEPVVHLIRWQGPWPDDDKDANLKADIETTRSTSDGPDA